MTVGLTQRQSAALYFIEEYCKERDASPSYEEIAKALNIKSKSSVHRLVLGLIERNMISATKKRARTIRPIQKQCPYCKAILP